MSCTHRRSACSRTAAADCSDRAAGRGQAHHSAAVRDELAAGTGGPAGPAVAALRAASIDSVPLLDLITLPESNRLAWEGRLSPYDRAIVVSRTDADADAVRAVLAAHPGTPVIAIDGPVRVAMKASPGDPGTFGDLLRRLWERMPDAVGGWVEDRDLGLAIGGGYDPPLTDREAATAAARATVDRHRESLGQQEERLTGATRASERARDILAAVQAATKLAPLQVKLDEARRTALDLPARIAAPGNRRSRPEKNSAWRRRHSRLRTSATRH